MFSNRDVGLTPCREFAHPQVIPLCSPPQFLQHLLSPSPPVIISFWEAHSSDPSLDRLNNICKVASLPSSPPRGKEPVPDGQEKTGVTGEGEPGLPGGAGEQGCGGSIKHLLGSYLGISQVLTDKLARLIRAIKAVWARVVS